MTASDYLNPELNPKLNPKERRAFAARSDVVGAWLVSRNGLWIALIFARVATWLHPLTIVLAVLVLGGRRLGLAVLMHEGEGTGSVNRGLIASALLLSIPWAPGEPRIHSAAA